jgi:signal transduction histidine kinase
MYLHIFIFGIISFQISYIITQWFFFRRKEYLYYISYLTLFLMYLYAYYEPQLGLTSFFNGNIDHVKNFTRISGLLIFSSYVVFARYFTDSEHNYPRLNALMKRLEKFLVVGFFAQVVFAILFKSDYAKVLFSWIFYLPGFIYALYLGIKLIKAKNQLANYILFGSLFAILGAFLQAIYDDVLYFFYSSHHKSSIIMELGFILEFLFLNIGFMAKNKLLQSQQDEIKDSLYKATIDKNEIAKQLYEVRSKLAMDLHDDVSSTLGSIRIVSEIMASKLDNDKSRDFAVRINRDISDLSDKLKVLVWSFNENNDTLNKFLEYLNNYIEAFINENGIDCKIMLIGQVNKEIMLDGNIRKNIFFCTKESLHNVMKYANATMIKIQISINQHNKLVIAIKDNGKGMPKDLKFGNGIINMNKRMNSIKGTCEILNDSGTIVVLECPIQ